MRARQIFGAAATLVGLLAVTSGCSRDHIEAINLANQGDQAYKVNVEGAIQKYEQAVQLDPTNHRIIKKLGQAYKKKEDWDKAASTMARAVQVAPDFADYWFERGYALIKKAETDANNKDVYEEAKEPLKQCTQKDPNFAECYHFLGQAHLWTGDEQAAIENYIKAIEHDPTQPYFYGEVAEILMSMRLYKDAEAILKEGTRIIQPREDTKDNLYTVYSMIAVAAQGSGDNAAMVAALEKANELAGDGHPEISFNLGSAYAASQPPQKEKAIQMLKAFVKRACRSANATKYKDECADANSRIQQLGGKID